MIDKLEQRGYIDLPPIRTNMRRNLRPQFREGFIPPKFCPIDEDLANLTPLTIITPDSCSYKESCFGYYLNQYHYLGFSRTVGENLRYMISDRFGRDVGCMLFGSAAWKTASRDVFIGWNPETRAENINFMTNNTRFLILPRVRVPHLASHILGRILRRIRRDWIKKYNHPVHMVETFVERDRFNGACYKAANWIRVGQTKGRSRQDRFSNMTVPIKDVYLYPLIRNFRQALCHGHS
ncbi:MAG: DUF4338 domain-containing protein [Gammaproteobacteria bacterium]|nr:DUF4338 domain-containing protein [Gammaproteobacteria bacterium]